MSIQIPFAGTTIIRPGAYSISQVSNANGAQLGTDDTILIVGEAALGAPGSVNGIQQYATEQLSSLIATYGNGPLVDCALAATRVSKDPTISGGAGQILVYKTNHSTQASVSINEATNTNPLLLLQDPAWGSPGNNISVSIANGDTAKQKNITINRIGQSALVLGENPATPVLSILYTGNGTAATAAISGSSLANKTLSTSLTGQSDSSVNLSIVLANYSMSQLVAFINAQPGYTAVMLDATKAAIPATQLDSIAATDIKTAALNLYRLQQEIVDLINGSGVLVASLNATPRVGLPVNVTNQFLGGGALGASANSDFAAGLAAALAVTTQQIVCAVSQDATADIAMLVTDPSSTYTIASVQAALATHLALRSNIQNRMEAQGATGFRSSTKAAAYAAAGTIGSPLVQMYMQDILVADVNSNLNWKQPHVLAAMACGFRLGQEVGEPLTHKFFNVNGVGHYVNPVTGIPGGDFNPLIDFSLALKSGVTFLEPAQGGFRIDTDNTTYGIDANFVWNRGSVVQAALYSAIQVRTVAEANFVGKRLQNGRVSGGKISGGAAQSLKNKIRQELVALWEANILGTSIDAPQGFVENTFVVTIVGNTATVAVEIKPIQGLDFILITFTLGQIQQTA